MKKSIYKKRILVVDAQGGGVGKQIIQTLKRNLEDIYIFAVGTSSTATANMLKGGADEVATGENAVKVASKKVDYIIGPLGIVIADSLSGEITPKIAKAIGKSSAERILIPFNHCNNRVVGIKESKLQNLINEIITILKSELD